eukprot:5033367-Lingulodinium_polyedra.AAC.1
MSSRPRSASSSNTRASLPASGATSKSTQARPAAGRAGGGAAASPPLPLPFFAFDRAALALLKSASALVAVLE